VANLPDRERKRQEAIYEFIKTEQAYVQALQQVIEVFFEAVRPALTAKAAAIIFANVEDILLFNTIFLSELEDRQRRSQLYIDHIGDIIKTHVKGLDVYRPYCVNQTNAANTLAELRGQDPNLRTALEKSKVNGLDLSAFLLEPMQRLTRYPLLIGQMLKYTEEESEDCAALGRALEVAERILSGVNEAVRSQQDYEKLLKLSDSLVFPGVKDARLDLVAPTRNLGPRKILKEGKLAKAKSGRKLTGYLFNDLLLFTEDKDGSEVVYKYVSGDTPFTSKDRKTSANLLSMSFRSQSRSRSAACASTRATTARSRSRTAARR
jgi:hypothetical protein